MTSIMGVSDNFKYSKKNVTRMESNSQRFSLIWDIVLTFDIRDRCLVRNGLPWEPDASTRENPG